MADKWPSEDSNLTLSDHLIWRFQQWHGSNVISLCITWAGHTPSQADIPLDYVPALACFDVDYWTCMALENEVEEGVDALQTKLFKVYMQTMREAIVEKILEVDNQRRHEESWHLDVIHEWCIRTWNHCSHSNVAREQFLKTNQQNNLTYGPHPMDKWRLYFANQSSKYISLEYRWPGIFHMEHGEAGVSPFDILRTLNMLPSKDTNDVIKLLSLRREGKASIHSMPHELLRLILFYLVDIQWTCKDVLPISTVCTRWRAVADSCPELWRSIEVNSRIGPNNGWKEKSCITSKGLVEDYLRKSRSVLLHLKMDFSFVHIPSPDSPNHPIYDILESFCHHAERWRTMNVVIGSDCEAVSIYGREITCIHHVASHLWGNGALARAQQMEHFHLRSNSLEQYQSHHLQQLQLHPALDVEGTFQLQDLRIDSYVGSFPPALLASVTSLSIGDTCVESGNWLLMLDMLDVCSKLTSLTIRKMPRDVTAPARLLPLLREIRFIDVQYPDSAFEKFLTPNLQSIEILSQDVQLRGCPTLESFLRLCQSDGDLSRITWLDVTGLKITNASLQSLLLACSNASTIGFRANPDDEARTGIFKCIRETLDPRMVAGKGVTIVAAGWIGRGKKNGQAMSEWQKLATLGEARKEGDATIITLNRRSKR